MSNGERRTETSRSSVLIEIASDVSLRVQRGVVQSSFAMAHEWSRAGMGFVNDALTRIRSGARIVSWTCELSWQLSVTPLSVRCTLTTGPIFSRVVMSCASAVVAAGTWTVTAVMDYD